MKVDNLVVLHSTVDGSDKVWGWFVDEDRRYHKYWGKRTGNKFQVQNSNIREVSRDKMNKIKKGYGIESQGLIFDRVERILKSQFGIQTSPRVSPTTQETSAVTGQEMEAPIRPSEVYRTFEANNRIAFYDKDQSLLGTRPAIQRDMIFNHIRKTKDEVPSGNTPEILWTDK